MSVASPLTDRTLGEFSVREKIGEGGFGAVYRAEQPTLGREAVVKVLQDRHAASKMEQRFLREAQLASRLDHPYAAHIYAFGAEPDGLLWIAMEYVRGTPLDRLLDRGPIPVERFVPLLERLAEVVQTAHDQRIIHRDIKPANVMVLERAGRLLPKLLDLGIARLLDDGDGAERTPPPTPPPKKPMSATVGDDDSFEAGTTGKRAGPDEPTLPPITLPKVTPDAATIDARKPGSPKATPVTPRLTGHGAAMGSPPYMAPEQWADTSQIDWRADLYALGVMTYESLTGRLPFEAKNAHEMARAHATEPVPALGPGFPAALDAVIARAMAKRPEDRWPGAVAFAAALREAAGLGEASEVLPHVDDAQRTWLLEQAPQPIAEAAALLDAARSPHQLRAAARGVVRPILRWLAAVALAARTRDAPRSVRSTDTDEAAELLRTLRRRDLVDEEVVSLVRELVRGFADRPHTHPIPELVEIFFPKGRADLGLFDELARERPDEPVSDVVAGLGRLVDAVRFFDRYPVVIAGEERAEKWVGLRRPSRPSFRLAGPGVEPGQALLVDLAGRPVLPLHPLVQLTPPTPGAPPEMFLFVGRGRTGARLVAFPLGFEQQDANVWSWLGTRFFDSEDSLERTGENVRPYRGLAAFQSEDAQSFFGREAETDALLNRLRVQPVVAIVGPSGAGKSSFVHAGALPALPEGWRAITVRPGPQPLAALAARLGLPQLPDDIGDTLRTRAAGTGETLVLVIDQLEELFTVCTDAAARQSFAAAVFRAARRADDPVRVVFTLRDDFLMRADQLPDLRDALARGLMLLGTPEAGALRRILVEPARRAGYDFEDAQLVDEMVAEVADLPGALALLSFTAAELWEARDPHFKKLSRRAYQALGGVGGALAKHAETTLAALPDAHRRLVREAFRHLVTADGTRAILTRAELLQVLGTEAAPVMEQLIAARLLVASDTETGGERIEIIHEALLTGWPRLAGWLREDAEGARLRDQLRSAARQWDERGRPGGLLWRGEALAELRLWRARHASALTAVEEDFASLSEREAARGRRRLTVGLVGAVVALALVAVQLYRSGRKAEAALAVADRASAESKQRVLDLLVDQGRQAALAGEEHRALVYLVEAMKRGAESPIVRYLVARAAAMVELQTMSYEGHSHEIIQLSFSDDGRRMVTASRDTTARVWNVEDGALLRTFGPHGSRVTGAFFDREGGVVTASWDGSLRRFSPEGIEVKRVEVTTAETLDVVRDAGGTVLLTIDAEGALRFYSFPDLEPLGTVRTVDDSVPSALIASPLPGIFAVGERSGAISVWKAGTVKPLAVCRGHTASVLALAFSADGQRMASGGRDRLVRLWRLPDCSPLLTAGGHAGTVRAVAISPKGDLVASASEDFTAKVWNVASGLLALSLDGHRGNVLSVAFNADGGRLLTGSGDGTAKIWDLVTGQDVVRLLGHRNFVYGLYAGDGRRIFTFSGDGSVKRWDARRAPPFRVRLSTGAEAMVAFDASSQTLYAASNFGFLRGWDTSDWRETATIATEGRPLWAFDPAQGRALLQGDGLPQLRDRDGRTRELPVNGVVMRAAFDADGGRLALAMSMFPYLTVWDTERIQIVQAIPTGPLLRVAWRRPGEVIAVEQDRPHVEFWTLGAREPSRVIEGERLPFDGPSAGVGGRIVTLGGWDRTVRTWIDDAKEPIIARGHTYYVITTAVSPSGALIASGGLDRTVRIWDATTGAELWRLARQSADVWSLAFAPDSRLLAVGLRDGQVLVLDVAEDGRTLGELSGLATCRVPFAFARGDTRLEESLPRCDGIPRASDGSP